MSRAAAAAGGVLKSKSPAEFFAEHQHIAGFDNPGKSLYTTIREFVENSLDAAEAAGEPPLIELRVEKLAAAEFNQLRGVESHARADHALYETTGKASAAKGKRKSAVGDATSANLGGAASAVSGSAGAAAAAATASSTDADADDDRSRPAYFRVTCRDNGTGIPHALIPRSLGIVLSSTKYGVKQTRGKFGLGAKMALVWAKKSTGLPVEVISSTSISGPVSFCRLDIDIYKNEPHVLKHEHRPNTDAWRGLVISVVIGGKWHTYQAKVLNYLRQLAVITPYAQISMEYIDQEKDSKSWSAEFLRRTDVMPPPAPEMKHHPSSVDILLVEQLIHHSNTHKLKAFMRNSFSSISGPLADRLIDELRLDASMDVRELSKAQIHQMVQLFRQAKFPQPDAKCLSPAGEYNLRLGIMKELNPELVATATQPYDAQRRAEESVDVYEGHPFQVEAAVSVGGAKARPGISVYRYANRIPLLFEGGNDVVSQVANTKIKWANYKLNNKSDKISVFCSIVSTKIPFKGTSKEYIGDDRGVLHAAVKRCISACCVQLKKRMIAAQAHKEKAERKKQMSKYIPDVARSFMTLLTSMAEGAEEADAGEGAAAGGAMMLPPPAKRRKTEHEAHASIVDKLRITPQEQSACASLLREVVSESVSEELLEEKLKAHVDAKVAELSLFDGDDAANGDSHDGGGAAAAPLFVAGMDTHNMEMRYMYGEDFKITYWH